MSDDAKKLSDPSADRQNPSKSADEKVPPLPAKDVDGVKGGAAKKGSMGGYNHNQTLRARRGL